MTAISACALLISPHAAGNVYVAEGVVVDKVSGSSRFYDTGKGFYLSWSIQQYYPELYELYQKHGNFQFLGELSSRMPASASSPEDFFHNLDDDSESCWAQVSMNLVEYWNSYYGVFNPAADKLLYGQSYDSKYFEASGGALSLRQNLTFLETFSNKADCLDSYLEWYMLGDDTPYYSMIKERGKGGFWESARDYWTRRYGSYAVCSNTEYVATRDKLSECLPQLLGYTRDNQGYALSTKGLLAYIGLFGAAGGHGITCHGFESDSNGKLSALLVSNSDDQEFSIFKLYIDDQLCLYTDASHSTSWKYAGCSWYIDTIASIDTPQDLRDKLASYEDKSNPLIWTGKTSTWMQHPESSIARALPDESSGWQVYVAGENYPSYFHESDRKALFDDSASSSSVWVEGSVAAAELVLSNHQLVYAFSGGAGSEILADELTADSSGSAVFSSIQLKGNTASVQDYCLALKNGASLIYDHATFASGACLRLHGASARFFSLTLGENFELEVDGPNSLHVSSLQCGSGVSFIFGSEDSHLTFSGCISAVAPIQLVYTAETPMGAECKLIAFSDPQPDWASCFSSDQGLLSYVDNSLYLSSFRTFLIWEPQDGIWSAAQWMGDSLDTQYAKALFTGDSGYTVSISGQVRPAAVEVRNTSGEIVFTGSGCIAGETSLVKTGAGKLLVENQNSFSGGTIITGGTLQIAHEQALGNGDVSLQNATLNMAGIAVGNAVRTTGNCCIQAGNAYAGSLKVAGGVLSGTVNLAQTATLEAGEITASLIGKGGVKVSGPVTLSGANSYTGGTELSSADLSVANASALGTGPVSNIGNSSILVSESIALSVSGSIINSGFLALSGVFDISDMAPTALPDSWIDVSGQSSQNGFSCRRGDGILLVNGGSIDASAATVIYKKSVWRLDSQGMASATYSPDYSSYLLAENRELGVGAINSASCAGGSPTCDIILREGTLKLDAPVTGSLTLEHGVISVDCNQITRVSGPLILHAGILLNLISPVERDKTYILISSEEGIRMNAALASCLTVRNPDKYVTYSFMAEGNDLLLSIKSAPLSLTWNGDKKAAWGVAEQENWMSSEGLVAYADGHHVLFSKNGSVTLRGRVSPGCVAVNIDKSLTFKSDKKKPGSLAGDGDLTKKGKGTLTLNDGNSSWTGDTYLQAGTIKVKGTTSLGQGDVYLQGGTLNLGSKAIANDIVQEKSAAIKSGRKFTGTYTLESGELQKGSTLNINKTATLAGGTVNGTLSGNGTTTVTGKVTLGDKGKITTNSLNVTAGGTLTTSAKGLSMNSKVSAVSVKEGCLTLGGKLSAFTLKLDDGTLRTSSSKPAALTLKGDVELRNDSDMQINGKLSAIDLDIRDSSLVLSNSSKPQSVTLKDNATLSSATADINGKFTANRLTLDASSLKLSGSKPQNLTVKQGLSIRNDSELSLNGKLSAAELTLSDSALKLSNSSKPQSVTVKGNATLSYATADIIGKFTANNLKLTNSELRLGGARPQNLTVKQNLTIGSDSRITLNGKLSAGSLSIQKDGKLTMSGSKPVTLKVKGALMLASGSSIILDYDFVQGKTYNLLTFGHYTGSQDFYSIFGVDEDDCTIQKTDKAITMTLTGNWNPQEPRAVSAADTELLPAAAPAVVEANPAADALVQANWGQLEASRAFVNAIANRSMAVQLGSGERAVWASAIGSSSRHSSAGGHAGADTNVSGGAFGLETQVGRASLFGLALGNSRTRVSVHGFGTIEQDTTHLGIYGRSNWSSGIATDWSAAYGRSESETMGSDWNQKHLQLDGRVSYNHELNAGTVLSPFAGMQYYASNSATVDGTSTGSLQNLRAEIGVGASHRMGRLGVYGEIALHQDLVRHNPKVSMEGLRFGGMNPGRTGLNFTVGASYELNEKWSVNASYTGEFVENANAHSANVGASYKF